MRRIGCFLLPVLAVSCGAWSGSGEAAHGVPRSFRCSMRWGGGARAGTRGELLLRFEKKFGAWILRVRRARPGKAWPPVYDRTFEATLPEAGVARLVRSLDRAEVWSLPGWTEGKEKEGSLVLELEEGNRGTRIAALGRGLPPLLEAARALDALSPVALGGLVDWAPAFPQRGRPLLVPSLERAIAFHRRWLAAEPGRSTLLLDLFALERAAGNVEGASRVLNRIRRDPILEGFVRALETGDQETRFRKERQ